MALEKKVRPESLDYLLAAIAPVFIIGMIGSLVFFLITVCYQGSYTERLMWILGLYTVAAVLIARIAIEQSRQLSFTYMFALAAATLFVAPQFFVVSGVMAVLSFPILVGLLVLVAVLADRITFDCTSMNEQVQSTGIGLLQSLGLVKNDRKPTEPNSNVVVAIADSSPGSHVKKSPNKRKHNPGVWVLYFALFALPLFGLGQLVIQSESDRRWAFFCLFIYLLSSLFLLVLISLLSLRKYLRERGVPMENSFAVRWLAIGMSSVFVVLCLLALLPIPGKSFFSMDLPFRITSRDDLKANRWGWGREGAAGEGPQKGEEDANVKGDPNQKQNQGNNTKGNNQPDTKKDGDQDGKGKSEGGKQSGDKKKGEGKPSDQGKQSDGDLNQDQEPRSQSDGESEKKAADKKQEPGQADKNDQKKGEKQQQAKQPADPQKPNQAPDQEQRQAQQKQEGKQQENQKDQQKEQPEQKQPSPALPRSIQWNFSAALQWLVLLILVIVMIVFGIKYRAEWMAALKSFGDWLSALIGGKKKALNSAEQIEDDELTIADLYPPFHTFANPFSAGSGWSREQMIRHMYRAVLSWGYEHRVVRRDDETPEEFMRRLARRFPEQQELLTRLGILYNRIAYARASVAGTEIKPMSELWHWLSASTASQQSVRN